MKKEHLKTVRVRILVHTLKISKERKHFHIEHLFGCSLFVIKIVFSKKTSDWRNYSEVKDLHFSGRSARRGSGTSSTRPS